MKAATVAALLCIATATVRAEDVPQCPHHGAPENATYRIQATQCPGAMTRVFTGFRSGDRIYTALHGIIGCKGSITAYPHCWRRGYQEVVLQPTRVARIWDLVELKALGGLQGPALQMGSSPPERDEPIQLCGFPQWNDLQATCSQYMTYQEGQLGFLGDLLATLDASGLSAKALADFGVPDLNRRVFRHELPGGGGNGFSGGPLSNKNGKVYAVHDGRLATNTYWAIPLFDTVVWEDWRDSLGQLRQIGRAPPPSPLHYAVPTDADRKPPPPGEVREALRSFFGSVLSTYACDWMRTGTSLLNNACQVQPGVCTRENGSNSEPSCGLDCVLTIYGQKVAQLKPMASLLCAQFAAYANSPLEALDCQHPENTTWFDDHKDMRFRAVFLDGNAQFGLMRELYFAAVVADSAEVIKNRIAEWAADAKARQAYWEMDKARLLVETWKASHALPFTIYDAKGVPYAIDAEQGWDVVSAKLLLFFAKYVAEGGIQLGMPACTNAHMIPASGRWSYVTGESCGDKPDCLAFEPPRDPSLPTAQAVAEALVFGAASALEVTTELEPAEAPGSAAKLRVKATVTSDFGGVADGALSIRIARLERGVGPQRPPTCVYTKEAAPAWQCVETVVLTDDAPSAEVLLFKGRALARRTVIDIMTRGAEATSP